jgi:ferredoxin
MERPLQDTSCVFCGLCVQACPTGALVEKTRAGKGREWEFSTVRTICPYCGVGCGLVFHLRDGVVVKAEARRKPDMKPIESSTVMRTFLRTLRQFASCKLVSALPCGFLLVLALNAPQASWAADTAKTFVTPEEAVAALAAAVQSPDGAALRALFGPAHEDIQNPDRVQATNELTVFAAAFAASYHIARESDTKCVLEVGTNAWPFPIPLVQRDGRWLFDTAAGKEEILSRRIGKNELAVLESMRAYVDAQREYASRDRDGDEVLEYAQGLASSPGTKDGLFWPPDLDGEISPLGPLVAEAQGEGYAMRSKGNDEAREPFHGYYFKILTRQGKHAPGGKYDYIINGNMIGGFALVAWPAEYGYSGIMTFLVNQQGRVYQKDLGPKTAKTAAAMKSYDQEKTWTISPD